MSTPKSEIKLLSASILWGCNIHHVNTVIRQQVDLGSLAGLQSGDLGREFTRRFVDRFGNLETLNPGAIVNAAFLDRLESIGGAPFTDVLFQAILAVEDSMACSMARLGEIEFADIVSSSVADRTVLVWSCRVPGVSRGAAEVGLIGLRELLPDELRRLVGPSEERFETAYRSLWDFAARRRLDKNSSVVVRELERRGIPWEELGRWFFRLGQGKFQHWINNSVTENTSFLSQRISRNKRITNRLLADVGVPVPHLVRSESVREALTAAEQIGYPVVVKPLDGNTGKGVSVGLREQHEIPSAFERAREHGSGVVVESFVEGHDYRLLIVKGQFVAALKRVPPAVTGDGRNTIGALIEELNCDPRRGRQALRNINLDDELFRLLDMAGYNLETVLGEGEVFVLRSMANIDRGGSPIDVTDLVHPDNQEVAIRAAETVGLDVAGVDFLISDIARSYKEVGGAIVEVNARPGLDIHTWPSEGEPKNVAGAVIETMFSQGDQGRVPVALVFGRRAPGSVVAHGLEDILRSAGIAVGLVSRNGAFVNGNPTVPDGAKRRQAVGSLLRDPRVEVLISVVSPRQVVTRGLVHNACQVAALIDPAIDQDMDELRQGLEVVARATRGTFVVSAANEFALESLRGIDSERVILVSADSGDAVVRRHLADNGAAVVMAEVGGERVVTLMEGSKAVLSIPAEAVPDLAEGRSRRNFHGHMFAIALAYAMDRTPEEIVLPFRLNFSKPGTGSLAQEVAGENN